METQEVLHYSAKDREIALGVSLTALAASLGYTPVRLGRHYSLKEMDSLVIYNDRTWNRFSGKGNITGGSQIDFLMEFGGVSTVPEAVHALLGFKGELPEEIKEGARRVGSAPEKGSLFLPPKNGDCRRLFAYLIKTRGISSEVVSDFVHKKLIYEDSVHHNIVSCGYDANGEIRYAGMRGTADLYGKKFRADVPGSDKSYGVNIVNRENDELKVFEAVIDCMSYVDLTGDDKSNKIVLGGTADNPLDRFLTDYGHIRKIVFCLDNDGPGQEAAGRLEGKYAKKGYDVSRELPASGKDFNECLLHGKQTDAAPCEGRVDRNDEETAVVRRRPHGR